MGSFEEKLARNIHKRVGRIGRIEWKIFQGFLKKIYMKRMSFTAPFKIELLLPFTGCRKVLGKMPARHLLEKRSLLANYLHKSILHLRKTINLSLLFNS